MNKTVFKQYDSRWGGKAYPSGSTVSGCGCGLLACTHMAIEQTKYKDYTPNSLREWMVNHGFAVRGQGTTWNGITLTLKHLGYSPKWITESMPMTDAWKELDKGNRIGIILFYGGYSERKKKWYKTPDGTVWTGNGHYVMFANYKVKNGKHYFYTKDSGARNHSGWYCYETSMKGCVGQLWIAERVGAQVETKKVKATDYRPSKPYGKMLPEKTLKMGSHGKHVKRLQRFLNWIVKTKLDVDGIFGEQTEYALMVYQKTYKLAVDGIFGSASLKKAKKLVDKYSDKTEVEKLIDEGIEWVEEQTKKGYVYVNWDGSQSAKECPICHNHSKNGKYYGGNCIWPVSAYLHHGMGLKDIKCACNGLLGGNDNYTYLWKKSLKTAQEFVDRKLGKGFKVIKTGETLTTSDLKKCDIVIYYNANVNLRTGEIYISNAADVGKVVHEFTHLGAVLAPEQFLEMSNYVIDKAYKANPEATKELIQSYKDTYKGRNLNDAQIREEVVADLVTDFIKDERFARDIAMEEPGFFQQLYNAICDILRALRNILATGRITDEAVRDSILDEIDAYEQTRQMWVRMMREAAKYNATIGMETLQEQIYREGRNSISDDIIGPEDITRELKESFDEYGEDEENLRIATEAVADLQRIRVEERFSLSERGRNLDGSTGAVGRNTDRGSRTLSSSQYRTVAKGITSDLVNDGYIDFRGKRVNGPEDLAKLCQVLRDPRFETFRIFLVKGNKIVSCESVSSRLPGITAIHNKKTDADYYDMIKDRMQRTGADGYYLMHNHPSGDVTASMADLNVSAGAINELGSKGYKGHVILDHDKFGLIEDIPATYSNGQVLPTAREVEMVGQKTFDLIHEPEIDHPMLGEKVGNGQDLARIGSFVNTSDDVSVLIYMTPELRVRGLQEISNKTLANNSEIRGFIRNQGIELGSSLVALYTTSSNSDVEAAALSLYQDGVLLDAITGTTIGSLNQMRVDQNGDPSTMGRSNDELKKRTIVYESAAGISQYGDAEVRFSVSEPVERVKDLIAVHNLKPDDIRNTFELGGFPMPSIAVTKDSMGHDMYGDITLMFNSNTIDPQFNRNNQVFGGDAYTPVFPRIHYKASSKVEKRLSDLYYEWSQKYGYDTVRPFYEYGQTLQDALDRAGGEAALIDQLKSDSNLMRMYLRINDNDIEDVMKTSMMRIL